MSLPLSGKVALVTGASRGIGAAIAKRLAADGALVVVNYVSSEAGAQAVVREINAEGKGSAVAVKADLSSVSEGVHLVEETVRVHGRLDVLVHNAAYMKTGNLVDVGQDSFDTHFLTNVNTPLFMTQKAAEYMTPGALLYTSHINA